MQHCAEVISIGDELTSGQRLDTNSQWLSQRLGELGVRVLYHTTVGDDLEANVEVFRAASERADIIVATGGLGPTADDLTRQAIATATGRQLVLNEAILDEIRKRFFRQAREMPEQNRIQAMSPTGSQVIPNPNGTAPGIDIEIDRRPRHASRIFALPGVPAEMREMWLGSVEQEIRAMFGHIERIICHRRVKCFGVGESHLEAMLPDLIRRGRRPSVGITVHKATITLRVTTDGDSHEQAFNDMQPTIDTIHEKLGSLIYGDEDDELEHAVARLLQAKNWLLATSECGTCGLIADWLGTLPNSHLFFRGGTVLTPISPGWKDDCASEEAVRQMAIKARSEFDADFGLAVGKFPNSNVDGEKYQQFYLGLAHADGVEIVPRTFAGHPDILRERSGKQALDLLRQHLLSQPSADD